MRGLIRCSWANPKNPLYLQYHDEEWGVPVHDDHRLFEMLVLESFQAGLSWECILNKREAFRVAFDGFDLDTVCEYGEEIWRNSTPPQNGSWRATKKRSSRPSMGLAVLERTSSAR